MASGDQAGVVKIWSLDNPEHPIKYEGQCLAGAITDIAWSPDSQVKRTFTTSVCGENVCPRQTEDFRRNRRASARRNCITLVFPICLRVSALCAVRVRADILIQRTQGHMHTHAHTHISVADLLCISIPACGRCGGWPRSDGTGLHVGFWQVV